MTRSLRRGVLALVLAAGLGIASAGVASAQSLADLDQRGDVQAFDQGSEVPTAAPNVANGDIVRSVLRHAADRVSVRIKFAELRRIGGFRGDVLRVVTNEGVRREVTTYAGPTMWRGQAEMTRPNGNTVDCPVRHRMDYDRNVVAMSFPRSCVSNPRWVRLGVGSVWMTSSGDRFFADDGLIDGSINPETVKLSPRLRRG